MISLTDFARDRHFNNPDFGGTKITTGSPLTFLDAMQTVPLDGLVDGYAPFCKHLFVENFTECKAGVVEITEDNRHLLQSEYVARRDGELPVLVRWFDSQDVEPQPAKYLDVILYSAEHLESEGIKIDGDWGIVSINAEVTDAESPMTPMTMIRNAMGKEHGGSGHPLDADAYALAVEHWSQWAIVK